MRHAYLPISRVEETISARARRQGIPFEAQFALMVDQRWQIYNSRALTEIREIQEQGLGEILSILFGGTIKGVRRPSNLDAEAAFQLVSDFLRRQAMKVKFSHGKFVERYEKELDLREVVTKIQSVMASIEQTGRPQETMRQTIENLYQGGKTLQFSPRHIVIRNESRAVIPLSSLSSGEKQVLQILLETMAAEQSPVIIDEPELSMHVDWQNRLIDSMTAINPDAQLILATHSPEVMANLDDQYIFQL